MLLRIVCIGVLIMAQNCEGEGKGIRSSPHAGTWYTGTKKALTSELKTYMEKARASVHGEINGIVSPHAGYMYSGPVAATAYKNIQGRTFDVVIVIGPSHYHGFRGASVDTLAGRNTPLGTVQYDTELAHELIDQSKEITYEQHAHTQEHSVEIQIPFLQYVLKDFRVVEIVMGSQDYKTCVELSNAIIKSTLGKKVLIVASSDLSHFHAQKDAEHLDNRIIEAVTAFDPEMLYRRLSTDSCEACGGGPIITTMLATKKLGATAAKTIMYATSGTVTGDYSRGVVGYLAAVFYKEEHADVGTDLGFSDHEKKQLKDIARQSIQAAVTGKKPPSFSDVSGKLTEPYGIFVTLNKHGSLRGCIGRIISDQPLYLTCQQMAVAAALEDPRFEPVTHDEVGDIDIEVSVLTPLVKVADPDEIVIGRDGLIIKKGYAQGLLLPQVATEYGWTVEEFLQHTCHKAGLPADAYKSDDTEIYKFSAQVF
jgi:AmmeMemoRadiSam system protein B/AmmeMemoRadiSam system protein A